MCTAMYIVIHSVLVAVVSLQYVGAVYDAIRDDNVDCSSAQMNVECVAFSSG